MKQFTTAAKALSILFALILAGCTSTETTESGVDDSAAKMEADAQAREKAEAMEREKAKMQALEDAMEAAGSVLYFDFDKATLTVESRRILDAHIALLKTNDDNVRLEGHTDERGTREYNMALGERRAQAVANYMSVNGISSYRVDTVSYGEERPAALGSGESNWQQNRRVEIK